MDIKFSLIEEKTCLNIQLRWLVAVFCNTCLFLYKSYRAVGMISCENTVYKLQSVKTSVQAKTVLANVLVSLKYCKFH